MEQMFIAAFRRCFNIYFTVYLRSHLQALTSNVTDVGLLTNEVSYGHLNTSHMKFLCDHEYNATSKLAMSCDIPLHLQLKQISFMIKNKSKPTHSV